VPQLRPSTLRAQIANPSPSAEEEEAEAGAPRIRVEIAVSEGTRADQENDRDEEQHPDSQLARPQNASAFRRESRDEPVNPEGRPSDGEDQLDGVHATHDFTSTGDSSRHQ
jgi:hypothetical protein